MKIYFLVLMTVFITSDIIVAAPGRANETSKSQLDMILLQMERQKDQNEELRHQVKEEQRQNNEQQDQIKAQERKNKELRHQVNEEQRRNNEQERKIEEQQRKNDELQHQFEEFTKINRVQRADSDIVKDLKKLILAEINGLSQCVVGTYTTTKGASIPGQGGFEDKQPVSFGRTFPRTPKIVASVAGFQRTQLGKDQDLTWGLKTEARSPTTTNFQLYMQGYNTKVARLDVSWIACA